jgi:manganese/iron transport system permease protein
MAADSGRISALGAGLTALHVVWLFNGPLIARWQGSGAQASLPAPIIFNRLVSCLLTMLHFQFMRNALLAGLLGGAACSLVGVLVVTMQLSFIGVALSHAAFAGALCGVLLGFNPQLGAATFSMGTAAVIGPLADAGDFDPDTPIGIVFSMMMGVAFLCIGLLPGPKTDGLAILWGNILTVGKNDLLLMVVVCAVVLAAIGLFYKEIQAVIFNREVALSVGIPAKQIFYALLLLTGLVITAALRSVGGLLIFNLIINPAAAAYQLTYNLKLMFVLAVVFGVVSCWTGLYFSYYINLPSGATISLVATVLFIVCSILSPKRKVMKWKKNRQERPPVW